MIAAIIKFALVLIAGWCLFGCDHKRKRSEPIDWDYIKRKNRRK
jgi:hypothetical protein